MASSWIKGITVEISGDTTGLSKSLKDVNGELKSTQFELNAVNKLLKVDPTNISLLAQKQELLSKAIETTKNKYDALVKVQREMETKGLKNEEDKNRYRELTREIESTRQSLERMKKQTDEVGESFKKSTDNALNFADIVKANIVSDLVMGGLKTMADTIGKITNKMADVVKSGVAYNMQMEQYQTSFTAMLGSGEEANALIERIKKNASTSPFDVASLVQSNQALLTTGLEAERSEKLIMALGDAVAYTGGGNSELTRMASNLQQIRNVGKASAMDIRQFAMAGIDIYGMLADSTGKTIPQIQEMEISFEMLEKAFAMASEEGGKYFGAMDRMAETTTGQVNLLKSNWAEFSGVIANDVTNALGGTFLPVLNETITAMTTGFQENGIMGMVEALGNGIEEMVLILIDPENIQKFFDGALELAMGIMDSISSFGLGGENEGAVREAVEKVVTGILEFLTQAIPRFFDMGVRLGAEVVSGFVDAIANSIIGTEIFEGYSNWLQGWSDSIHKSGGYGSSRSGGYGALNSGGFNSSGVTLNASFTINNGNNIDSNMVRQWAISMADIINDELGGKVYG